MKIRPAALAAALVLAALAAGAAVAASFTDPVGDVIVLPEGATLTGLDATSVEVTNTHDGVVTFRVTLVNAPAFPANAAILLLLDLDKNVETGDDGFEALIAYVSDPAGATVTTLGRYSATENEIVEIPGAAVSATFADGVLTMTAPRTELLDTRGFTFGLLTAVVAADNSALALDAVPDTEELLVYDLEGLPPPPPPKLSASRPVGTPVRPLAGKRFTVSSLVTREDTGDRVASGSVACIVRVGRARVRAAGTFRNRRAQCAVLVPRNAKGKTLRGTMTVRSADASVKRQFSFRVG